MHRSVDRIELSWLVTVRWATLAACVGALVFGRTALHIEAPLYGTALPILSIAITNIFLLSALRFSTFRRASWPGLMVCADILLLTGCLAQSGGVLNPASIFFLVEIVLAALVLGRPWTWIVASLSIAGYGVQMFLPTSELAAAATMHPQIAEHVRGMWWAFLAIAVIIGVLVTRLAVAIERRDGALAAMRDDAARQMRLMSLASMAAGAAHELSTPLGTIAVAAGELARTASTIPGGEVLASDIALIRSELSRSRRILTDLSGRADEGSNVVETAAVGAVIERVVGACAASDRSRIVSDGDASIAVSWPLPLVARALGNVVTNALQASNGGRVQMQIARRNDDVEISVTDTGAGMDADTLSRAGDPFFTRKSDSGGTGLGLFVSRAIAEQLQGRLTIDSAQGHGTTVRLYLPRKTDGLPPR